MSEQTKSVPNKRVRKKDDKFLEFISKPEVLTVALLILLIILMSILRPATFLTWTNFFNIIRQVTLMGILAVGMGLVIVSGGIDLSVGSTTALAACGAVYLAAMTGYTLPPYAVLLATLFIGSAIGFVNGVLIALLGIPPFIATLGMLSIGNGVALLLTHGAPILYEPTWISWFGGGFTPPLPLIGAIPISVFVFIAVVVVGFIFANYTVTGRNVYAVGNSPRAAKLSGIKRDQVIILVYTITGFLAGICGLLLVGQMNSAHPSFASGIELHVIAATVIGGVSMTGGEGNILGTAAGAILIGLLRNMFVQLSVPGAWQTIVVGIVIIGAVAIDSIRKKLAAR